MDMHGCNCIATCCMKELMLDDKCCKGCSNRRELSIQGQDIFGNNKSKEETKIR